MRKQGEKEKGGDKTKDIAMWGESDNRPIKLLFHIGWHSYFENWCFH